LSPFGNLSLVHLPCHFLTLQGSKKFHSESLTSDDFLVIVDSSCTIAASGDLDDFEPATYTAAQNVTLQGISAGLSVAGIGYVNWTFFDQQNKPVTMRLHAIHVPGLAVHLLPPQQIVSSTSPNCRNSYIRGSTSLTYWIHFPDDQQTNLPTQHTIPRAQWFTSFKEQPHLVPPPNSTAYYTHAWFTAYTANLTTSQEPTTKDCSPTPVNLTMAQQELLQVHH